MLAWKKMKAGPAPHIAFSIGTSTPFGLNPRSDSQFWKYKFTHPIGGSGVPGAVKPQTGGKIEGLVSITVPGIQAAIVQNGINEGILDAPNYDIYGGSSTLDCASWAQEVLGNAGINTGASTEVPKTLMIQLDSLYPQF
jgi:hypothetical protein